MTMTLAPRGISVATLTDSRPPDQRLSPAYFSNVVVAEDATAIDVTHLDGEEGTYPLDEVAERALAEHLSIPVAYLRNCPPRLKAINLNTWLRDSPDDRIGFIRNTEGIEQCYDPEKAQLLAPDFYEVIANSFRPDDVVHELLTDTKRFHADIIVGNTTTVPGNGLGDRPDEEGNLRTETGETRQVFDITHGGVRILAERSASTGLLVPTVERYFNRLICTNGLTMPLSDRRITMKGKTVSDIRAQMADAVNELLETMDEELDTYASLAQRYVGGSPYVLIRALGHEAGLPAKVIEQALSYAEMGGLGHDDRPETTVYDLMNVITATAAQGEDLRYGSRLKVQRLGGFMVNQSEEVVRRCRACARPTMS